MLEISHVAVGLSVVPNGRAARLDGFIEYLPNTLREQSDAFSVDGRRFFERGDACTKKTFASVYIAYTDDHSAVHKHVFYWRRALPDERIQGTAVKGVGQRFRAEVTEKLVAVEL